MMKQKYSWILPILVFLIIAGFFVFRSVLKQKGYERYQKEQKKYWDSLISDEQKDSIIQGKKDNSLLLDPAAK